MNNPHDATDGSQRFHAAACPASLALPASLLVSRHTTSDVVVRDTTGGEKIAYGCRVAGEDRRVAAQSAAHAQGLTDNLLKQGFAVESQASHQWVLRKKRRRGDHVVTIAITQPSMVQPTPAAPPPAGGAENWAPPRV